MGGCPAVLMAGGVVTKFSVWSANRDCPKKLNVLSVKNFFSHKIDGGSDATLHASNHIYTHTYFARQVLEGREQ